MDFLRRLAAVLGGVAVLVGVVVAAAGGASSARAEITPDYRHALQIVADLRAFPPEVPLVVLLGGSSQRSSTVSDLSLTRQIRDKVGYKMVAFNLGSKERLLTTDRRLIGLLPDVHATRLHRRQHGPVLPWPRGPGRQPAQGLEPGARPPDPQHRAHRRPLGHAQAPDGHASGCSSAGRRSRRTTSTRWACSRARSSAASQKGQHPVIIDLPLNMAIIGHQLDRPLDAVPRRVPRHRPAPPHPLRAVPEQGRPRQQGLPRPVAPAAHVADQVAAAAQRRPRRRS